MDPERIARIIEAFKGKSNLLEAFLAVAESSDPELVEHIEKEIDFWSKRIK